MEKVQKREGLLCICAECKRVIRGVAAESSDATPLVSHGICPECAQKLYGDIFHAHTSGKRP